MGTFRAQIEMKKLKQKATQVALELKDLTNWNNTVANLDSITTS